MVSVSVGGREGIDAASRRLQHIEVSLESGAREAARRAARVVRKRLREEAPPSTTHRHRRLKESITFRTVATANGAVVTFQAAWYARYVLGGTKPHDEQAGIYSHRHSSHALNLPTGPVATIHHPGARSNDFRQRAADAAGSELGIILSDVGEGILRGDLAATAAGD